MHKHFYAVQFLLFFVVASYSQLYGQHYEVGRLIFKGNEELNEDQLLNVIHTRETPWALWKWIYNRFDKEILGGQKPEYFDPIIFTADYHQLKRYYADNGFFHCRIDTNIKLYPDNEEVFLTFSIIEGHRSVIDTVIYRGFENLPSEVLEELTSNKQIEVKEPYVKNKVEAEHYRIIDIFANNGYVNVKVVSLEVRHYASTDNLSIVFTFDPGKRYTFGKINVDQDSTAEQKIDSIVVIRHLDFTAGEFYSEQKKIESERNLNRLGVFESTKIENAIPEVSSEITSIPVRVIVRTRSFQELTPEIGVNDENNAFNVLFGIGYSHRNFFGGARNFSTRLRFNIQTLQFGTLFRGNALKDSSLVSKVELTTQLIQPYFFNNKTSLSIALTAMVDKQPSYYIPSLSSRIGTQSQTGTYTRLFIDWNLQLSDPKKVATLQDTINPDLGFIKQFNSFVTITLQRDKRNDIFNPSVGVFQSISVEEGGLFPRAFGNILGLNLPYSKYVKMVLNGQWYWDPSNKRTFIWATRWRTGAASLYGYSPLPDIPLSQRFYSGGSGSVRGWRARGLGASMTKDQREQGSNALFEGNIEGRWNLLNEAGSLWFLNLAKISVVFFYDCGNIWTAPGKVRLSEIAMAFGFGLRYNTVAGPIRIDFGMKLFDPDAPASRQWVTQKRFFPETFKEGVIHLGVGHTF
jgi:outer membrane protein assembly complex protein YaeT